ncbi:hypothetical protein BS47DRAFT_39244 [Hydnum rufescens UP504]|uniref:Secreted protein n=1 Tax=Hydnum rufescens UP504 TaxID=1448309 RepID=A0A9P6ARY6_9AGAM|nr:hypothetical protein BS47DRAFT_39244 [Hydnum rufescens UP504]
MIRASILGRSLGFLLSLSFPVGISCVSDEMHSLGVMERRTPSLSSYRVPEVVEGKNLLRGCLGSSILLSSVGKRIGNLLFHLPVAIRLTPSLTAPGERLIPGKSQSLCPV